MAGGPQALDARDAGIAKLAQLIEQRQQHADPDANVPDLAPRMLIGGVQRLLASRLRRGTLDLASLHEELLIWLASYEQPAHEHRWRQLTPIEPPATSAPDEAPLRAPKAQPPGRPRISEEELAENHRQRIMFAAAQIGQQKGYTAATITDLTRIAEANTRAFYRVFLDKQDAFMALNELVLHHLVIVTARAFFSGGDWPNRMWEGISASLAFMQRNPTIAHAGFVESYAIGPGAVQRVEDSHLGFTIFLQEGYQHKPTPNPPSRTALDAIAVTQFELGYHQTRENPTKIASFTAHLVHLALAPFLGPEETNEFIEEKLGEETPSRG